MIVHLKANVVYEIQSPITTPKLIQTLRWALFGIVLKVISAPAKRLLCSADANMSDEGLKVSCNLT